MYPEPIRSRILVENLIDRISESLISYGDTNPTKILDLISLNKLAPRSPSMGYTVEVSVLFPDVVNEEASISQRSTWTSLQQ